MVIATQDGSGAKLPLDRGGTKRETSRPIFTRSRAKIRFSERGSAEPSRTSGTTITTWHDLLPYCMNLFGTEFTTDTPCKEQGDTGGEAPPEPIPIQSMRGGDASDILPETLLRETVAAHEDSEENVAETAQRVRGEFASLQRILETRIPRYDAALDVVFEDTELVVYELDRARDFENVLDFCEIEPGLLRRVIVSLMQAIATDRADAVSEYPLVVRKPTAFRAGERHARARLSRSDHTE